MVNLRMETTAKYYTSISELPLSKFKECSLKGNYYALVIEGQPTQEQLKEAWLDIVEQHNEKMGDNASKFHLNLLKEVGLLEITLQKIDTCIMALDIEVRFPYLPRQQKYRDRLNEMVSEKFAFNHDEPDKFNEELKRARRRSKGILLQFQLKAANLKAINEKNGEMKKPSFDYYDSILNELTIFAKTYIDDHITVSRFLDLVLKYNSHIKFLESQNKK